MKKSTALAEILKVLTTHARGRELTDSEWAQRAGVRKETLSRLRRRESCDFETLRSLAQVAGARLAALAARRPQTTADGHFPARIDRDYEERLLELCACGDLDPARWLSTGPRFFMAGLAVLLAGSDGMDRSALLSLAEELHPGASTPAVFDRWLARSPVRPSRFLPLVDARLAHAT
jgi:hypothetical protein